MYVSPQCPPRRGKLTIALHTKGEEHRNAVSQNGGRRWHAARRLNNVVQACVDTSVDGSADISQENAVPDVAPGW